MLLKRFLQEKKSMPFAWGKQQNAYSEIKSPSVYSISYHSISSTYPLGHALGKKANHSYLAVTKGKVN